MNSMKEINACTGNFALEIAIHQDLKFVDWSLFKLFVSGKLFLSLKGSYLNGVFVSPNVIDESTTSVSFFYEDLVVGDILHIKLAFLVKSSSVTFETALPGVEVIGSFIFKAVPVKGNITQMLYSSFKLEVKFGRKFCWRLCVLDGWRS